mmetsp:Transcript_76087/g.184003  ORF Transcript_76087/g.184003 Transcript_76087/m.184003 type:complete len:393 (-) Transcript_76087:1342-2520(-)
MTRPSCFRSRIRRRMATLPSASTPAVGSSRTTNRGSPIIAMPSASRRFCPPLSFAALSRGVAPWSSPVARSVASVTSWMLERPWMPANSSMWSRVVRSGLSELPCATNPMRASPPPNPRPGLLKIVTLPMWLLSPSTQSISVDLPAPLWPSSTVTCPAGKRRLTSSTATLFFFHGSTDVYVFPMWEATTASEPSPATNVPLERRQRQQPLPSEALSTKMVTQKLMTPPASISTMTPPSDTVGSVTSGPDDMASPMPRAMLTGTSRPEMMSSHSSFSGSTTSMKMATPPMAASDVTMLRTADRKALCGLLNSGMAAKMPYSGMFAYVATKTTAKNAPAPPPSLGDRNPTWSKAPTASEKSVADSANVSATGSSSAILHSHQCHGCMPASRIMA